jgi:hypothetical protein
MSLKTLSEAIILQSAEDLLSASHRREGLDFFSGEGFGLSAEMAGMTHDDKVTFLHLLLGCIASGRKMRECSDEILEGNRIKPRKLTHSHRGRRSVQVGAM